MAAKNGGRRPGAGRKKGSLGKERRELMDLVAQRYPGYDPVMAMIEYSHSGIEPEEKFKADKEIAPYIRGKLASVSIEGNVDLKIFKDYSPQVPDAD